MATTVTQYGITWTWVENLTVGQYANGDYYVVAPSGLTMTSITPLSVNTAGRITNGTMRNPNAGAAVGQGFDSNAQSWGASLNVARPGGNDMSVSNPLAVPTSSSLVSSISIAAADQRPQVLAAAVLTVVPSAPAANSFRPPYCGSDKTSYHTVSDLDYSILKSYFPVSGTPTLATVEAYFARPWIEIITEQAGRDIHPKDNQPDYGRDMANQLGDGLLSLHLNYSNAAKATLMIRLVQYGLDVYGAAVTGGNWVGNGGHNQGRKMPMMLAGRTFNDSAILAYGDAAVHNIFQEDKQTFTVSAAQMSVTPTIDDGRQRSPYGGGSSVPWISPYTSTVTISQANPAVVTWPNHGLPRIIPIYFTTTGTLPAPLQPNTEYLAVSDTIAVTSVFAGQWVSIASKGNTTWSAMGGASSPADGDFFKATGAGTGTGTVNALPQNSFKLGARDDYTTITTTTAGSGVHTGHFSMLGVAEWGEKHTTQSNRDASNWNAYYRDVNSQSMLGATLSAILTDGVQTAWNHSQLFDYMDRAFRLSDLANFSAFTENMWTTYRNGPPNYPILSSAVIDSTGGVLTLNLSLSCTTGAGGNGGLVLTSGGVSSALVYSSGSGSSAYVYTVSPVIKTGAGVILSYTQPGNGIESTSSQVDLPSFSDFVVTNNSTVQAPAAMNNGARQRLFPMAGGF